MENSNEPSEDDLFVTTSVQNEAPQSEKKTKSKRKMSLKERERLLSNLKRGRETAARNRKLRAEAKKKNKAKLRDEENNLLHGNKLVTNSDIVNRLNTIETLLSNLKQPQNVVEPAPEVKPVKEEELKKVEKVEEPIIDTMIPELEPLSNFKLPEW